MDVAPYHNNMVGIMWHLVFPCTLVGATSPAARVPTASPLASPCARRAVDVAPYHNNMFAIIWHLVFPCTLVGADVPGGPRPDGVSAGVPVCAARRGRRALPG